LRHQLAGNAELDAAAGIGDDLPADVFAAAFGGVGELAAFLRMSTPVSLPPRAFWKSLIAATMRSLTSPVIAPLYWPTQARSDCSASRSPCAIALAVSAGVCSAGRIGVVATALGLVPAVDGAVNCAWAGAAKAVNINVAVSIDLMTNLAPLTPAQLSTSDWSATVTRRFKALWASS
jgi:hypothetical protein